MHCNPAPPHPPPGEIYNVICVGRPYVDGIPMGYAIILFSIIVIGLLHLRIRHA